jgi:acetyltransferase
MSLGNKSAMDESDCLSFLAEDPETMVIGMYLEDVGNGEKFRKTLERVAKKKPVIILKGGATKEGSTAAMSHTGSMVGDDEVFEAVCRQSFAIRVHKYYDFYELLKMYSYNNLPTSRHILVLSNAGGMGVLLADQLISSGLYLVMISEKTKKKLYGAFDDFKKITVHNPIDLLGDASAFDYEKAVNLTVEEKKIGGVMVLLTPQANTEIMPTAEVLVKAQKKIPLKPIYPVFMGEASVTQERSYFEQNKMASFSNFDTVPEFFARVIERQEYIHESGHRTTQVYLPKAHTYDIRALLVEHASKDFLNQYDSLKVLEYAGLKTAKTYVVTSEKELEGIVQKEGYPLVAKIASDKITHKTEVKGVITGLNSWDEVMNAYIHFQELSPEMEGCYIQKQYSGYELILGAKRDHTFGSVVLLGLGGIYAELLHEVIQLVYPFSYAYFECAVRKTKLYSFVKGYRSMPQLGLPALYEYALKLGELIDTQKLIKEIDINPLMVGQDSMVVADGLIIIDHP